MMQYFDAHSHLESYGEDVNLHLAAAQKQGVGVCACAMSPSSAQFAREIAKTYPLVVPCFGVHPLQAAYFEDRILEYEEEYASCAMVGEIGLDKKWSDPLTFPAQLSVFEDQLFLAHKYGKAVNVHTAGAEQECLALLQKHTPPRILIHWYAADTQTLDRFLDLGCFFTAAADVSKNPLAAQICRRVPTDRLLCETDGADAISWALHRSPESGDYDFTYIKKVYEQAAKVKNLPLEPFRIQINRNVQTLFA